MIWVVLGLLAGGTWAGLGHGTDWTAPLHHLIQALTLTGTAGAQTLVRALGLGADSTLAHTVGALAGTLSPGMACLGVAEAVTATRSARTAATVLATALAVASFCWLPGPQALALLLVVLILDVILAFGRGPLLQLPAAAGTGAIALTLVLDCAHSAPGVTTAAATAAAALGGSSGLWRLTLTAGALAPALGAVALLTKRP